MSQTARAISNIKTVSKRGYRQVSFTIHAPGFYSKLRALRRAEFMRRWFALVHVVLHQN